MERPLRESLDHRRVALLEDRHHVVWLGKGHLDVELGELVDAVGARILVAEAARDLNVLVDPADHEDLLQHLRRLRQGPELSGVVARRHDEVARPGWVGADHHRGLDLPEASLDKEIADEVRHLVAQLEDVPRSLAPKIHVAVLPAKRLLDLRLLVHVEGRRLRLVQYFDLGRRDFHLTGRELRVLRPFGSRPDRSADAKHPLVADLPERLVGSRVLLRMRDNLRDPVAIAQVDERELAMIAAGVDPAGERYFLAGERGPRLAAGVCSQHLSNPDHP